MRALSIDEVQEVNGGVVAVVGFILTAAAIYEACDILYEFGKGVVEGYQAHDSV
jgi:hypothetical protein